MNRIIEDQIFYWYDVIGMLSVTAIVSYVGVMLSSPLSDVFSRRIKDKKELESVVQDEGILTTSNGQPLIRVGGTQANRNTVRHELYHLYRNHRQQVYDTEFNNMIDYWFNKEPKACLYALTGIKLR